MAAALLLEKRKMGKACLPFTPEELHPLAGATAGITALGAEQVGSDFGGKGARLEQGARQAVLLIRRRAILRRGVFNPVVPYLNALPINRLRRRPTLGRCGPVPEV